MEKVPKPFSEEKAEEIMKTEEYGYEERNQAEQDAFEAGQKNLLGDRLHETRAVLENIKGGESPDLLLNKIELVRDIAKHKEELMDIVDNYGLSKEAAGLLFKKTSGVMYSSHHNLVVSKEVEEDILLELAEKLPDINSFQTYFKGYRRVIAKIRERFPGAYIFIHGKDEEWEQ